MRNLIFKSVISLLICFGFLSLATVSHAVIESSGSAKPGISYPVAELGNCASKEECRSYCELEENRQACIDFGSKKGIYKENKGQGNARDRLILEKAKTDLGCSTKEACKILCESSDNADKCNAFAAKYGINPPKKTTDSTLLEKAKEILGCQTPDVCRELCQKSENREKCKEVVLKLSEAVTEKIQQECTTGKECELLKKNAENLRELQKKCQENATECLKKKTEIEKKLKEQKTEICKKNPKECEEMQKNVGRAQKAAMERAKLCKEKPEECSSKIVQEKKQKELERIELCKFKPEECENENAENEEEEEKEGEVQGIQKVPSFIEYLWNKFF